MTGGFQQAIVYLFAALLAVPVAKRLGLGSVLGYLLAGVAIGPAVLGLTGDPEDVMHFAEFGVVMMLFLIGLELRPALLWQMRGPIFGLGGSQVSATAILITVVAILCGQDWQPATAIGLTLALSSTAIALQSLDEKGLAKTPGGEASFSVLLFQDIAVIPILAFLPLLASHAIPAADSDHGPSGMAGLAAWQQAILVLASVAAIIFAGRFLLRPIFRYIAETRLREMFTASALLLVLGIAALMQAVGLSPALGTFLAGVVLAESEYRVQLEADIEPFKGLLLGLFFISVGASLDFGLMATQPLTIALLVAGLLFFKFAVLFALGTAFRIELSQRFLFACALAQGGEFAFVLLSFATTQAVLPAETADLLVSAVALSMAAAPLLLLANDRLIQPSFRSTAPEREADTIDEPDNPVILAGFGRFGHVVGRLLRANGFPTTVLDHDPDQVETLRSFGLKSFYGDASRLDLLRSAGADRARLFVVAIDDDHKANEIIRTVQQNFPDLRIIARATSRQHAYELVRLGIDTFQRDTFGSALDLSVDALKILGISEAHARRAVKIYREHDEKSVREMALLTNPGGEEYISQARQHIDNLERLLRSDDANRPVSD